MSELPALIDRLAEAALDCRAAVREAHEATKDLNAAIREARTLADGEVRVRLNKAVELAIEELGEATRGNIGRASDRILKRFDELAGPLLESFELLKVRQGELDQALDAKGVMVKKLSS
ncbi:MAG TPA: hypothetical protein VLL25_12160 [Acidimicrobiales bacterium]|nr:hypothetical protein [Acidimicrobiales bacterium]